MTFGNKNYITLRKKEDVRLTKFLWKNVATFVYVYSDNNNKLKKLF